MTNLIKYNIFRWYRASSARYTQSDPIGLYGGSNLFAYSLENPLRYIDRDGRAPGDKTYGLPKSFWNWYHDKINKKGDPDLEKEEAERLSRVRGWLPSTLRLVE